MSLRLRAELGRRIRERRDKLGRTQAWLAEQVGLSRTAITNIECGRQRLLVEQLITIATVLSTSADLLLRDLEKGPAIRPPEPNLQVEMPTVARWLLKLTETEIL
jgi:transcriptional regulator with XRE-family HTH domain